MNEAELHSQYGFESDDQTCRTVYTIFYQLSAHSQLVQALNELLQQVAVNVYHLHGESNASS